MESNAHIWKFRFKFRSIRIWKPWTINLLEVCSCHTVMPFIVIFHFKLFKTLLLKRPTFLIVRVDTKELVDLQRSWAFEYFPSRRHFHIFGVADAKWVVNWCENWLLPKDQSIAEFVERYSQKVAEHAASTKIPDMSADPCIHLPKPSPGRTAEFLEEFVVEWMGVGKMIIELIFWRVFMTLTWSRIYRATLGYCQLQSNGKTRLFIFGQIGHESI